MLNTFKDRGNYIYIYNGNGFDKYTSINQININDLNSDWLIGCIKRTSTKFLEENNNSPFILSNGIPYINSYKNSNYFEIDSLEYVIYTKLNSYENFTLYKKIIKLINSLDIETQEQTSILIDHKNLYICKDLIGIHPLYLCKNNNYIAISSEKKAFYINNIEGIIEKVLPGSIYKISKTGKINKKKFSISKLLKFGSYKPEALIDQINTIINKSIKRRIDKIRNLLLLYSGGIDSSIIRYFLIKSNKSFTSLILGIKGSKDIRLNINLYENDNPIHKYELDLTSFMKNIEHIFYLIEKNDFLILELSFLFYEAAKYAKKYKFDGVFTGQGADELFAGYKKYRRFLQKSYNYYKKKLNYDLNNIGIENLESCDNIYSYFGINLFHPYLDLELIKVVRLIEPKYLILDEKNLGKSILRLIAKKENLPENLIYRKKSALQYSTRIHHELDKLLRNIGFNKSLSKELGYGDRYRELFMDYLSRKIHFPSLLSINQYKYINNKIKINY